MRSGRPNACARFSDACAFTRGGDAGGGGVGWGIRWVVARAGGCHHGCEHAADVGDIGF